MALASYTGDFGEPIRKMFASMVAQGQEEQTPTTPTGPTLPTYPTVTATGPVAPTATTGMNGTGWTAPTGTDIGQQQVDYYKTVLPSYAGSDIVAQELKGQLPDDVITQIQQVAGERGVATGMPGSPASNASMLRALGLTSYQMQQQGLKNLNAAYGVFPQVSPTATMQANLEAWKTTTGQNLQRELNAQDNNLKLQLAEIAANTSLTNQQREIAAAQVRQNAQLQQERVLMQAKLDAQARGDAAMAKATADMLNAIKKQGATTTTTDQSYYAGYDPASGLTLSPYVSGGTVEGSDQGTGEGTLTPAAVGGYYSPDSETDMSDYYWYE